MQKPAGTWRTVPATAMAAAAMLMAMLVMFDLARADVAGRLAESGGAGKLRREGSQLTTSGWIRHTGDRWVFEFKDGDERMVVLENQALQRVSANDPDSSSLWHVVGSVTEYQGNNYLLIAKATRGNPGRDR